MTFSPTMTSIKVYIFVYSDLNKCMKRYVIDFLSIESINNWAKTCLTSCTAQQNSIPICLNYKP